MNITRIVAASESGDATALAEFLDTLRDVQITKYTMVATFMLFVYDWSLTFDEEVNLVWPSRWGAPKILFFLNRYTPLVDLILLVYVLMVGSDASSCVKVFQTAGGTVAFGFVIAQVILAMRTWAIWARKTWVTSLLGVLIIAALIVDVYVLIHYLGGVSYASLGALQAAYTGCPLLFSNRFIFVDFVIVIVTESVMLALLVGKALEHFKHSRSTLMVRMFKDGVVYFIFILLTSIANLVTILSAPIEMHEFLIITQRILHSIFCTRVLLHIRGAYTNNALLSTTTADSHTYSHTHIHSHTHTRTAASGAHYSFRRPVSSTLTGKGRRDPGLETFELASVGVISGEVHGGDGDGWGMGNGFDGARERRERRERRESGRGRDGKDLDLEDTPPSATSSTFPPFSEEEAAAVGYYEMPYLDTEEHSDSKLAPR